MTPSRDRGTSHAVNTLLCGVNAAKTMQHAWFLALLALPAARAIACECDEWRNGATAEDPALCRKLEGGLWMC